MSKRHFGEFCSRKFSGICTTLETKSGISKKMENPLFDTRKASASKYRANQNH